MKIRRTMPDEGWVPVANTAARDRSISWRARGLLLELLSYPDGWETSVDKLVTLGQLDGGHTEGRDAMRSAMNELIEAGYVIRTKYRDGGKWKTTLDVSDQRRTVTEKPASGNQASADQSSGNQASEIQASLLTRSTNTETNKDLEEECDAEYSESLTSFAVAADAPTDEEEQQLRLKLAYEAIDLLDNDGRRAHLLVIESKRPQIYREARKSALAQIREKTPQVLKSEHGARVTDHLSYKYVAMHYVMRSREQRVPDWLSRHLYAVNDAA